MRELTPVAFQTVPFAILGLRQAARLPGCEVLLPELRFLGLPHEDLRIGEIWRVAKPTHGF
jgi:hypothetical protein